MRRMNQDQTELDPLTRRLLQLSHNNHLSRRATRYIYSTTYVSDHHHHQEQQEWPGKHHLPHIWSSSYIKSLLTFRCLNLMQLRFLHLSKKFYLDFVSFFNFDLKSSYPISLWLKVEVITAAEEIRGSTSPPSEKAPLQPKTAFGETRSKSNYLTIFVFTQPPKMIWKVIYIFDTTMNPHVSTLENLLLQPNFIKKIPQAKHRSRSSRSTCTGPCSSHPCQAQKQETNSCSQGTINVARWTILVMGRVALKWFQGMSTAVTGELGPVAPKALEKDDGGALKEADRFSCILDDDGLFDDEQVLMYSW